MGGKLRSRSADAIIGVLADLQHGAVARYQLLRRGVTPREIEIRIGDGRLRPVHRGVYLVGHLAAAALAHEAAAVLACGPGAVISHRSAAKLHSILPYPATADRWVTTARGDRRRPGLIVRRGGLDRRDVTRIDRVPVTTAARTILDCAAILPGDEEDDRLERMCAEAHALHLARLPDLRDQIERNPGRRGVGRLMELLDRHDAPRHTKRELERRLLRLVLSSELPHPETNQWIHGREVDMLWRDRHVVVEADSYAFHSHARRWARDIGKTNELQLHGYIVLRFTWFDVTDRPSWVIAEIDRALLIRSEAA